MAITKKQKEVFEYIKKYTQENDMAPTLKEIKDHFKLKSFGSVSRYISYLIDAKFLERDWNKRQSLKVIRPENPHNNIIELPLLGDIAAGIPIEAIENPTSTIDVPSTMVAKGHQHYALTVSGQSMIEEHICDGDIAIIRYQKTAEQGEIVVAIVDGEATLKQFYSTKNQIELRPKNHTMHPLIINPREQSFQIAGILVGLIRTY